MRHVLHARLQDLRHALAGQENRLRADVGHAVVLRVPQAGVGYNHRHNPEHINAALLLGAAFYSDGDPAGRDWFRDTRHTGRSSNVPSGGEFPDKHNEVIRGEPEQRLAGLQKLEEDRCHGREEPEAVIERSASSRPDPGMHQLPRERARRHQHPRAGSMQGSVVGSIEKSTSKERLSIKSIV